MVEMKFSTVSQGICVQYNEQDKLKIIKSLIGDMGVRLSLGEQRVRSSHNFNRKNQTWNIPPSRLHNDLIFRLIKYVPGLNLCTERK